ncbi:MAG: helix-turn-helix domain-containing protein [Candidatus Hodarchaeales archaeon]|jgi:sugar-specific transcriptional regulator TrmB
MEDELQEFGLSKKESVILNCLINSRVPLSGNEIAKKTGVTRYYAYEVLHRLQERGFVEFLPGRPKRYAFDSTLLPEIIEQEERKINRDWQLRKSRLQEIAERIQSIEPSAERVAGEYVTLWKGPQVSVRVEHLIASAQKILLLRTYPTTTQDEFSEIWKPIQALVQKGGRGRVLLGSAKAESLIASFSTDQLAQLIGIHSACPIRVSNTELVGFDIIDSKMTLEFLSPTTADIRLVIREPDAIQAKIALFDSLWARGQDFRILAYAARDDDPTIERSLQDSPPHIPLPDFQESGVHRFPSRMEAIKALQKIMIESAKNEIIFANLESIPVDEELRYAVDEILKALSVSHKKDVNWRVLWKPHPEIDEDVLKAFLDTLRSIPSLEIRFWEGSLDLGTFFLIDNSILLIPVFPLEHYENAILVTRNPIIKHLVVRGFNQLWSLSPTSELETRF